MQSSGRTYDGYIRVSRVSGREGPSYISPTVQREQIERWAGARGLHVDVWHVDEDWSGGAHSRPGLDSAVERAVTGVTEGILSAKIERFSRATEQGLRDLRRLNEVNAQLGFVMENLLVEGPMGKLFYTLMLAQAEFFLEQIKESWRIAKRRAMERGAVVGPTPYGYSREEDGTLSIDAEQAEHVREAYRRAAARGAQDAVAYLVDNADGRRWTTATARRMLGSRVYLGSFSGAGDVYQDDALALVSRGVWEAAQSAPSGRAPRAAFPLSGVPTCGACKGHMIGARAGANVRTYRCAGRCDKPAQILADTLERDVRDQLAGLYADAQIRGVGGGDVDRGALLEHVIHDAEAELDAFAADLTMRRALGVRYHEHLQARVAAVDAAQSAYREWAGSAVHHERLQTAEIRDMPLPELGLLLRGIGLRVLVRPGRGGDRVSLVPFDDEDAVRVLTPQGGE